MPVISITPEEAMLVDWVLTMHTYDYSRLEQLKQPDIVALRKRVSPVILGENPKEVDFLPTELDYLLISLPITFRFAKEDVGFSLKTKLFASYLPKKIKIEMWKVKEDVNENNNSIPSGSSDQNHSTSSPSCLP